MFLLCRFTLIISAYYVVVKRILLSFAIIGTFNTSLTNKPVENVVTPRYNIAEVIFMGLPIYDNIDRLLKEKRMSRRQLAIMAGIGEGTMSTAFTRRSTMFHPTNLQKIAAALDVTIEELTREQPQISPLGMIDGVPTAFINPAPGTFYFSEDGTQRISAHAISEDECNEAMYSMIDAFDTLNPAGMLIAAEQVKLLANKDEYKRKQENPNTRPSSRYIIWNEYKTTGGNITPEQLEKHATNQQNVTDNIG